MCCLHAASQANQRGSWTAARSAQDNKEFDLASAWKQQFIDAVMLPEDDSGNWVALTLHYVSITWKVYRGEMPAHVLKHRVGKWAE